MSCSSEINACPQTVSDVCVRYTGPSVPSLEIVSGDTLSTVEEKFVQYLTPLLTGVGDEIIISPSDTCTLITQFLTGTPNSKDLFRALSKAVCNLQTQITSAQNELNVLNADYTIGCLTGVTASSDTHTIVQAIITKLCQTIDDLAAVDLDLTTNYVKLSELNSLIAAYLETIIPPTTQYYQRMIPWAVVEYYGTLDNFDENGVGLESAGFTNIYLCNGLHGTPDKRGRSSIGSTDLQGGGPLNPVVDPALGNPTYAGTSVINGQNNVTLNALQIPSHSHGATAVTNITPNPHDHGWTGDFGTGWPNNSGDRIAAGNPNSYVIQTKVQSVSLGATTTVTVQNAGGGEPHINVHPVLSCYYIMYIPPIV